MSDPQLHSLHLPAPRRALFRQVREILLENRSSLQPSNPTRSPAPGRTEVTAEPASARGDGWGLFDGDRVHPLRAGINLVGRFDDNHVVVSDLRVSRRHCVVVFHPEGNCEVHDTASKNGTFVNGQRITAPKALVAGDMIELGDCRLVLQQPGGQDDPVTLCEPA